MVDPEPSSKTAVPKADGNWQDSLNDLERELAAYREAASSGATEEELASAAARVTNAVQLASRPSSDLTKDSPPVYQSAPESSNTLPVNQPEAAPTVKNLKKLKRNANPGPSQSNISSDASSDKSENPAKQIGRGLLMMVATPIALAGVGLYAAGTVIEGSGMILKGMGSAGKKPFQKVVRVSKGKKRS